MNLARPPRTRKGTRASSRSRAAPAGYTIRYIVTALTIAFGTVSQAEPIDTEIRQSLVHLKATGMKHAGENGTTSTTWGTGFIVSTEGLVLTTHDLISDLGSEIDTKTVRIEAHVQAKNSPLEDAIIVDHRISTDILLLKLRPRSGGYVKIKLGNAHGHADNDPIYTSGFPTSINYIAKNGKIEAREASAAEAYAWRTTLKFEDGLSGSPVYNGKGMIIGVLKSGSRASDGGSVNGSTIIPIGFADTVLAQVRLREIQKSLGDFDVLRRRLEWALKQGGTKERPELALTYTKMVPGDPQVSVIDIEIAPHAEKDGKPTPMSVYTQEELKPKTYARDNSGGSFDLPKFVDFIHQSKKLSGINDVKELKISINATMQDGTKTSSTTKVPYVLDDK